MKIPAGGGALLGFPDEAQALPQFLFSRGKAQSMERTCVA